MFGIGMNEFLLLVLLALVLIGPKQLPEVARGIGKLLVAFRRATSDLRRVVGEEINAHPEYRELSKLRDEISDDIRGVGNRARQYMEKEFEAEKRIAGAVEGDVQALGSRVESELQQSAGGDITRVLRAHQSEAAQPAEPPADAAPPASESAEPPADRTEFDKAYRSFYRTDEPAPTGAPATTGADSPEDALLRERELNEKGEVVAEDSKAGMYLLRSGGRGGGRGGPYTVSPTPAPKPERDAESPGAGATEPGRASGDKA